MTMTDWIDGPKIPIQKSENTVNVNTDDPITEKQTIEGTKDLKTVIADENADVNNKSDWQQKPISLKGFKKKLNEIFIVK